MPVILGTVSGWDRGSGWSSTNRIYTGPAYTKYVGESISQEEAHYYRILLNITVYLYDSPCSGCNVAVVRKINNIEIIGLYNNEFIGGLREWSSIFSISEAEELLSRSLEEVAGLIDCNNCDRYNINITESEYIPPLPPISVIPQVQINLYNTLIKRIKKENNNINNWRREIDTIKEKSTIKAEDIKKIRGLNNKIDRSFKILQEDESTIQELEDRYPGIEDTLK